ncbi:MAG: response regulator [Spirochaetales bacterium]|nr:response regulator [Spirochaetales bacterium]MCF7939886.1 response regulator [Spirochaetales bacterium]
MKKVLIIDESPVFRDYMQKKLAGYGLEVVVGINGLDGTIKMRNEMPDLVIMDFYLSRKSSLEVLEEKSKNPNTKQVPVIMASSRVEKEQLKKLAVFGVKKFFAKPIKIDSLIRTISDLLGIEIEIDTTPCIIEAHYNEEVIFIEVARGLNLEKIELLKYKLDELLDIYQVEIPKVLVMMSAVEISDKETGKIDGLLQNIIDRTKASSKHIKVLTSSDVVISHIKASSQFSNIEVHSSLEKAMDSLLGKKAEDFREGDQKVVQDSFLSAAAPKKEKEETIQMRFDEERGESASSVSELNREARIAIVDDDFVIQEMLKTNLEQTGWEVITFENGKDFVDSIESQEYDLVFLDLMMPEMNGIEVLQHLKKQQIEVPIVVLSALSKRETVVNVLKLGVKSYLIKPLQPEEVKRKTHEILGAAF